MGLKLDAVGVSLPVATHRYRWQDVVLYALGVGASIEEIEYLYEKNGPKVLPSYIVTAVTQPCIKLLETLGGNLESIVHHSQKIVLHRPITPEGSIESTVTLEGIYDLKRMAQAIVSTKSMQRGELLAETEWSILFLGEGGFSGPRPPKSERYPIPKDQDSDFRFVQPTTPEQAALYRLSGDLNPLHIDQEFARNVGFDQPILHGLCTFGIACRAAILENQGQGEVHRLQGQFRNPVFPGDTVVVDGWAKDDSGYTLQVRTEERPETVAIGNAFVEFAR